MAKLTESERILSNMRNGRKPGFTDMSSELERQDRELFARNSQKQNMQIMAMQAMMMHMNNSTPPKQ